MLTRLGLAFALFSAAAPLKAQVFIPATSQRAFVDQLSPRMATLSPVFLGHLADPVSDAARNPALLAESGQVALIADGFVETWALHGMGGSRALGWSAALMAGPTARFDYSNSFENLNDAARDTSTDALVPASPVAGTATRIEARLGLSSAIPAGRLGAALTYARQLDRSSSIVTPSDSARAGGDGDEDGWGATAGWVSRDRNGRGADLAAHWQTGETREETNQFGFSGRRRVRTEAKEAWARLAISLTREQSLSAVVRHRSADIRDSVFDSFGSFPTDSASRQTDIAVSVARRFGGSGWSAFALAGGHYQRSSGDRTVLVFTGGPGFDTAVVESEQTRVAPFLAAAGEAHVLAGITLRVSVVARLTRRSSEGAIPVSSFPPRPVTTSTDAWQSGTDVRVGLGFAPPGAPVAFDLYVPSLTEPRRWMVAASYRL